MSNSYQHRKWRRLLMIRDSREVLPGGPRMCICALCGPDVFYRASAMQAHHIRPAALYPELSLKLRNGVMLCAAHHQGIVHNNNAAVDITDVDWDSGWKSFVVHFSKWNAWIYNTRFNAENQERIADE